MMIKNSIICTVIVLLTFSASVSSSTINDTLSTEEIQWLSQKPTINYTGDPNWLPYEAVNKQGEHVGIVSKFISQFARDTGIRMNYMPSTSWGDALTLGQSGNVDAFVDVLEQDSFQETHEFTQGFLSSQLIIVSNQYGGIIDSLGEVGSESVMMIKDYGYVNLVKRLYPDTRFIAPDNINSALKLLEKRNANYLLASHDLMQFHQSKNNNLLFYARGQLPIEIHIGLAVRRDQPHLISIFNKWLARLSPNERYQIAQDWYETESHLYHDLTIQKEWLIAFVALLILLLIWSLTNRKLTRESQISEQRISDALSAIRAGEWEYNFIDKKSYSPKSFFKLLGIADSSIPRNMAEINALLIPEHQKGFSDYVNSMADIDWSKHTLDQKYKIGYPYNKWIHARAKLSKTKKNTLIGTLTDITDLVEAVNTSKNRYKLLTSLFDILPSVIFSINNDGLIELKNSYFTQEFELKKPIYDIRSSNFKNVTDYAILKEKIDAAIHHGESGKCKLWVNYNGKEEKLFSILVLPFSMGKNEEGVSALVMMIDETSHYQLTQSLKSFKQFAMYSAQGFGMCDLKGNVVYKNPILENWLSEVKPVKEIDKGFLVHYPASLHDKLENEIFPAVNKNGEWQGELQLLMADGTLKDTYENHFQIMDENGQPILIGIVIIDISQIKELERELIIAKKESDTANNSKSVFLANMSHEIRTPLNSIMGYSQMLMQDSGDEDLKQQVSKIYFSGERLLHLINDVLDLTKIEAGKLSLKKEIFNIYSEIASIIDIHSISAEKKSLVLKADILLDEHEFIQGDKAKIGQIIINLLGNAIKFTERGQVSLEAKREGDNIYIEVSDTGVGIDSDEIKLLFSRFHQGSEGAKKGGTGLGLALSKELATAMKGDLVLKQDLLSDMSGATFVFHFPAAKNTPLNIPSNNFFNNIMYQLPKGIAFTALVIEDDPNSLEIITTLLTKAGFHCICAESGEQGLEQLTEDVDVIFTDIRMGEVSGIDILRNVKSDEKYNKVPIIAVSASSLTQERDYFINLGFDDYISKPLEIPELMRAIEQNMSVTLTGKKNITHSTIQMPDKYSVGEESLSPINNAVALSSIDRMLVSSQSGIVSELKADLITLKDNTRGFMPELLLAIEADLSIYDFENLEKKIIILQDHIRRVNSIV